MTMVHHPRIHVQIENGDPRPQDAPVTIPSIVQPFMNALSLVGLTPFLLTEDRLTVRRPLVVCSVALLILTAASTGVWFWKDMQEGVTKLLKASVDGEAGTSVRALLTSSFCGLLWPCFWATAAISLTLGNHRFLKFLALFQRVTQSLQLLPGSQILVRRLERKANIFKLSMIIVNGIFVCAVVSYIFWRCKEFDVGAACISHIWLHLAADITWIIFTNIFFKFAFFGMIIAACFDRLYEEVEMSAQHREVTDRDVADQLVHLFDKHHQLSLLCRSLIQAMTPEIIAAMYFGIVETIFCFMTALVQLQQALRLASWHILIIAIFYYFLAYGTFGIAVVVPCEVSHRVIAAAGRARDPLWTLRRTSQHEQLLTTAALYSEIVEHDRANMGNLHLFRLNRNTTISCLAVIITYIIVLMQFLASGNTSQPLEVVNGPATSLNVSTATTV